MDEFFAVWLTLSFEFVLQTVKPTTILLKSGDQRLFSSSLNCSLAFGTKT